MSFFVTYPPLDFSVPSSPSPCFSIFHVPYSMFYILYFIFPLPLPFPIPYSVSYIPYSTFPIPSLLLHFLPLSFSSPVLPLSLSLRFSLLPSPSPLSRKNHPQN